MPTSSRGSTSTPTDSRDSIPVPQEHLINSRINTPISRTTTPITNKQSFEERVMHRLEKIVATQEQSSIKIDQILRHLNSNITADSRPENLPSLPLETKVEFKEIEQLLLDKTTYNYLVSNKKITVTFTTINYLVI